MIELDTGMEESGEFVMCSSTPMMVPTGLCSSIYGFTAAVAFIALSVSCPAQGAGVASPSRQDHELVMAAVNIGMTEAQRYQFRDIIVEFVDDYRSAMRQIALGHNATDLERRMEKKRTALFRRLDRDVAGMLTEAQFARYADYRWRLLERLSPGKRSEPDKYLDWELPPVTHH